MKKVILMICLFFIGIFGVSAKTISVEFSACVDGDTAKFVYNDEVITARFLAIDTPETKHPTKGVEPYGEEASEYTCNKLTNANEIKLEYDEDSDETDKYDRHLVWVFVDGELLQKKLVSKGLASVAYLYGDYKYTEELETAEQEAEDSKLGIWSSEENNNDTEEDEVQENVEDEETTIEEETSEKTINDYKELIIIIGVILMLCLFSAKTRKEVKKEAKKQLKKELKKRFK